MQSLTLTLVASTWITVLVFVGWIYERPVDPFAQSTFVCYEDEVLGYDARFGPDRVGCLHVEEVGR
jgi:hypothetical protein